MGHNFEYTSWRDMAKDEETGQVNPKFSKFLREMMICCSCDQMVINCQLEDKVNGLGEEDDKLQTYLPLNVCIKCLEAGH